MQIYYFSVSLPDHSPSISIYPLFFMKRSIFKILLLLFVSQSLFAGSITVTGKVSGVWNVDTVLVAGDLLITADTSLEIVPGTRIIFTGHYLVSVKGQIYAEGTVDQPILFTVADTTGFSDSLTTAGSWHGFLFYSDGGGDAASRFFHCHFEYAKAVGNDSLAINGGVIRCYGRNGVVVEECEFNHNYSYRWGGAVYMYHSNMIINRCIFRNNQSGTPTLPYGYGGALCSLQSDPEVTRCVFTGNRSTGVGGGASFERSDPQLQYNIFENNFSGLGGALSYLRSTPSRVVSDNLMYNNEALFFGGAVCCIRSNTVFANNTITGNLAPYGGGLYANDSACPSSYNTIYHGNAGAVGKEVYIWDIWSAPNFFYCDVAGGTEGFEGSGGQQGYHGMYENNIDTLPGFKGVGEHPYALVSNSVLIDLGTPDTAFLQIPPYDLAGNDRILNHRIDIGAYEHDPSTGNGLEATVNEELFTIQISPNPTQGPVEVWVKSEKDGHLMLTLITPDGRQTGCTGKFFCQKGRQKITLDPAAIQPSNTTAGSYYLIATLGDKSRIVPLILIR